MKYFLDTEFSEGFRQMADGNFAHIIELISIGIVNEKGDSVYAVSNEFNTDHCNDWVKENVLPKLPPHHVRQSLAEIRSGLLKYFRCTFDGKKWHAPAGIQVYAYYGSYDWVVFCSLFGAMVDLPKGFPMYPIDLKQMMDDRDLTSEWKKGACPDPEGEHNALVDANWNKQLYSKIMDVDLFIN